MTITYMKQPQCKPCIFKSMINNTFYRFNILKTHIGPLITCNKPLNRKYQPFVLGHLGEPYHATQSYDVEAIYLFSHSKTIIMGTRYKEVSSHKKTSHYNPSKPEI